MRINRRIKQLTKSIDIDIEVKLDYDDIDTITDNIEGDEERLLVRKFLTGKKFTKYVEDFNADIYFDMDDILELVNDCNDFEKEQILDDINYDKDQNTIIKCETLYDEQKMKVLKTAFDKYNLDELLDKLSIKPYEY